MTSSFKDHVQELLEEHRGERIFRFEYLGKQYWLKQPEPSPLGEGARGPARGRMRGGLAVAAR